MNTVTLSTQDPESELRALAAQIEEARAGRGLTKARWLKTYPELGTDKTYSKITSGNLVELDTDRWLDQYRHVWHQIESTPDDPQEQELFELTGPMEFCRAFLETARERGNARVLLLQGESGTGKTSTLNVLCNKPYGARCLKIEATDAWKDRKGRGTGGPLLRAIARALGLQDLPNRKDELVNAVVEKLCLNRKAILIDEAHHLCPEGVNIIKHLVNLTPGEFVLTALPSLWQRLESSREAWIECRQLTGNRLAERIVLTLDPADVLVFMEHKLGNLVGWTKELAAWAAKRVAESARSAGNLAFVRDVAKRLRKAVEAGEELKEAAISTAVAAELKSR